MKKDRKTVWLKREDFARVLLKFCPNTFETGESISQLRCYDAMSKGVGATANTTRGLLRELIYFILH